MITRRSAFAAIFAAPLVALRARTAMARDERAVSLFVQVPPSVGAAELQKIEQALQANIASYIIVRDHDIVDLKFTPIYADGRMEVTRR